MISRSQAQGAALRSLVAWTTLGCGGGNESGGADAVPTQDASVHSWEIVHQDLRPALMSVWGSSASDVWAVGGDPDGTGPAVLHWDGAGWTRLSTAGAGADTGDLWWVFGFAGGPVYMGGSSGRILRWQDGAFTRLTTPTTDSVFGIWGSSPTDVWAVGGAEGGASGGFAWKLDGDAFVPAAGFPAGVAERGACWKVSGSGPDDVWIVGTDGLAIRWNGLAFDELDLDTGESLFTVTQAGGQFAAAGGFGTGLLLELEDGAWTNVAPSGIPGLIGVARSADGGGLAVGTFGTVLERRGGAWREIDGPATEEALHAVWIDPDGGAWIVGGQVQASPLVRGVLAYRGERDVRGEIR